jgi:hypothetical protein
MSKPEAFIIMPYKDPYENVYKKAILTVLKDSGFEPVRADEAKRSTPFSLDIEAMLRSSDLVIAEVSDSNLNVYYELGLANALKKEIILLSHDPSTLPSDTKHVRHLVYDVNKLNELKITFKEWVEKSRAYQFKTQKQTSKVLNRGDIFRDITDATFYLSQQRQDDRQDILTCLRNGSLIPTQYLYKFDRGSTLWLDLCQDAEYRYFVNSINFFQKNINDILDVIGDEIVTNAPDYISLGPGNGAKDKMFLTKIMERQKIKKSDIYYYPFDISPTLISDAIRNVTRVKSLSDNIKIKAVVCDFSSTLKSFSPVYQYRTEPNIFTLLGNTLGNMDRDVNFLDQIHKAMFPGDILIVEVRSRGTKSANIGGSMDTNKKFDFTPLDILGVAYNEENLTYSTYENRSYVPETETIIASYHNFYIPGDEQPLNSAYLSYIHEYKPECLQNIFSTLGYSILKTYTDEGLACYVLKKPN